ncbi:MAG: DUF1624 domain-containing protein [Methanomicrobiales archaeon]|nr:DUF1624 domain-containing protein [Methanomicrobiales archaeon]
MSEKPVRYPELDGCRGLAVFMMMVFHFFVDLSFLELPGPDPFSGLLRVFGILTATLFIGIAGVSAHIKGEKTPGWRARISVFLTRGGKLLLIGCGITLVTWWFLKGEGFVVFGILHLIGVGLVLTPVVHRFTSFNLVLAGILLLLPIIADIPFGPVWMAWAGIHPEDFSSIDYTPVIPWLAPFFLGLFLGKKLYPGGKPVRRFWQPKGWWNFPVLYAGRHSLVLYLVHQPVLIVILSLFSGKMIF